MTKTERIIGQTVHTDGSDLTNEISDAITIPESVKKIASTVCQGYDSLVLNGATLDVTNGIFHRTNGKGQEGYVIETATKTQSIAFSGVTWTGLDYVCETSGGFIHEQYRPSLKGLVESDTGGITRKVFVRDEGLWYDSTDGVLGAQTDALSPIYPPVRVDNGTPQFLDNSVEPYFSNMLEDLLMLGNVNYGFALVDETNNRDFGQTYINSTGHDLDIYVSYKAVVLGGSSIELSLDGGVGILREVPYGASYDYVYKAFIPRGAMYSLIGSNTTLLDWYEVKRRG